MHKMWRIFFQINKSIQGKILIAFILVTMFSLIFVSAILYFSFTNNIKQDAVNYVMNSMRHADENLNIMLEDIEHISTVVVTNKNHVIDVLGSEHYEVSYEWFLEQKDIKEFLSSLKAYKSYISRIAVVGLNGKIFFEGTPWISKSILEHDSLRRTVNADGKRVWIKQNGDDVLWNETVTLGRAIQYEKEPIGAVMIDIDYDVIKKTYDFAPSKDSFIFVVEPGGGFVYHTNPDISAHNITETSFAKVYHHLNHLDPMVEIAGQHYLVASYTSDKTGWTTIGVIPEHTLLEDSIKLRNQIVQILLVVFIIVFVVSAKVATHITKNLKKLQKNMNWVKDGNLTVISEIHANDEVGELSHVFNKMLDRLKGLLEDIKHRERQKREAELAALQAQISPHFLYNTLNTIKYLARLSNVKNVEEVTTSLIRLLRAVVGNTKEYISIREEIEYVKSYISIQEYKYIDSFHVHYELEKELLNCKILKLILQPVIENSIIHGVSSLDQGGAITIKLFREGKYTIKFEVTDNGPGMSQEQIERTLQKNSDIDYTRFSGMGISNVHERIRMLFGEPYGVTIISKPGLFTTVNILIPWINDEGDNDE